MSDGIELNTNGILKMKVEDILHQMDATNLGYIVQTFETNDEPIACIIIVSGKKETRQILDATDSVSDTWREEAKTSLISHVGQDQPTQEELSQRA